MHEFLTWLAEVRALGNDSHLWSMIRHYIKCKIALRKCVVITFTTINCSRIDVYLCTFKRRILIYIIIFINLFLCFLPRDWVTWIVFHCDNITLSHPLSLSIVRKFGWMSFMLLLCCYSINSWTSIFYTNINKDMRALQLKLILLCVIAEPVFLPQDLMHDTKLTTGFVHSLLRFIIWDFLLIPVWKYKLNKSTLKLTT
mgnify:CR=1 FL=1